MKIFKKYKLLILLLIITSFFYLFRINYPGNYVFDEVYHGFTAREYLKNNPDAWDFNSRPPEGVAYEWTHPPLAKELMALSMLILHSTDPWAYRLPGVFFGILSVYLVYYLSKQLFKNETTALISAFIYSISGLVLVQARTAMNDIYMISFVLISLILILRKNFLLSSIFFGLALASKWSAIYFLPVLIIIIMRYKLYIKAIDFLIFPAIIYFLSYTPYFLLGFDLNNFIHLQKQIYFYHSNLKATHNYSSPWWSWPFNLYPVWYFVEYHKNNLVSVIFASGNPLVFWAGFIALIYTIWDFIKLKSEVLFLIIILFFAFFLPWALSPRIMFLYHYTPSLPFLSIALGYQLQKLYPQNKYMLYVILGGMFVSFLLVYPILTGIPISRELINLFFWTNASKNPFGG